MASVIEVQSVFKTYPRSWFKPGVCALSDVSLSIGEGETFGFVGQNGAGKSTLIKILVGCLRPTSGVASLNGLRVGDPAARRGLGFVPENPSLQEYLTPYELLLMSLRLHGVRLGDERAHCLFWLDRFGLLSVADKRVKGFSKGMLQRAALAHALVAQPRLLILDEPLSGLDPVGRKDVVDILDDYRRNGGTLFFSSHVLYDVERIADRFGLIHQGRLLTIRSPQDLVQDQAHRYLVRFRGGKGVPGCVASRSGVFVLEMSAEDLSKGISTIQAAGGTVQDVRPQASLESVFFNAIASAPAPADSQRA